MGRITTYTSPHGARSNSLTHPTVMKNGNGVHGEPSETPDFTVPAWWCAT
jgi:hypothetical protein